MGAEEGIQKLVGFPARPLNDLPLRSMMLNDGSLSSVRGRRTYSAEPTHCTVPTITTNFGPQLELVHTAMLFTPRLDNGQDDRYRRDCWAEKLEAPTLYINENERVVKELYTEACC